MGAEWSTHAAHATSCRLFLACGAWSGPLSMSFLVLALGDLSFEGQQALFGRFHLARLAC